jgi:hypothetical protein
VLASRIDRMIAFRDWLRAHAEDRAPYEREKRALASRQWRHVQNYADAKTEVIERIPAQNASRRPRRRARATSGSLHGLERSEGRASRASCSANHSPATSTSSSKLTRRL